MDSEIINNQFYNLAKKIRTSLLLYTEKDLKNKQKLKNSSNIYSLRNKDILEKEQLRVSFDEYFVERNVQIITQEFENKEKLTKPTLLSISSLHISEKSLCTYKSVSDISTLESFDEKNIKKEKLNNQENEFFSKKTNSGKNFLFEKNFVFDEKANLIQNKQYINSINDKIFNNGKTNNIIGEKYLKNLVKFFGVIRKRKSIKKLSNKKSNKKNKAHKEK